MMADAKNDWVTLFKGYYSMAGRYRLCYSKITPVWVFFDECRTVQREHNLLLVIKRATISHHRYSIKLENLDNELDLSLCYSIVQLYNRTTSYEIIALLYSGM